MVHREPGVGTFTSLWYIIFSIKFLMFEISTVQVQLFVICPLYLEYHWCSRYPSSTKFNKKKYNTILCDSMLNDLHWYSQYVIHWYSHNVGSWLPLTRVVWGPLMLCGLPGDCLMLWHFPVYIQFYPFHDADFYERNALLRFWIA